MARIRTIKPEFWVHPIIARQDDATKLMAIALLNYSDDEGFFHAEPNLVRGFCRPFDDNSTITRQCLENLCKIGYISIAMNENYGPIGKVNTFSEHQKIDRPTSSKLKQYYSTNTRRKLDDKSLLEGNREQGIGKGTGKRKPKAFIPPTLDEVKLYFITNGFTEAIAEKMFRSYSVADWHDSKGNPVLNWKQKAVNNWFKDENKRHVNGHSKPQLDPQKEYNG